jgi:hypothetical protein
MDCFGYPPAVAIVLLIFGPIGIGAVLAKVIEWHAYR